LCATNKEGLGSN